jgi:hypothetical protein
MVTSLQRFASDIRLLGFHRHRYTELGSNTTDSRFPTFNSCHLLDEMFFISAAKASFWETVFQLALRSLLDHVMSK